MSYKIYILIGIGAFFFMILFPIVAYKVMIYLEYGQWSIPCVKEEFYSEERKKELLYYNEKFDCYSKIYDDYN